MYKHPAYRVIQIVVIFGFPLLGFLYAYQFTDQSREIVVPFKSFKAPPSTFFINGDIERPTKLDFDQPIAVVNYWASWCPPCVDEFPAMMELKRRIESRGVRFIFVSVDDKWDDVVKFQKDYRIHLPETDNLWDPGKKNADLWGSTKFPETYVVRRDGWVVEKIIGFQTWTRPAVINYFLDLAEKFQKLPKSLN